MGRIEAVIFDWAGTTVDYGCFAPVQAFVEVFREFGMEPTMEETREPMGMLKIDHIRTMLSMERIRKQFQTKYGRDFDEEDVKKMYAIFEEKLFGILDQFTEVKPEVLETIQALREKGIKIGSTTGYTDAMMEIVTKGAEENGYTPDCVVSPDAVGAGRPYPYMVYENMRRLQVMAADQVMKVGDTISDIKEGKNAGVFTVGVVEGSSEMGLSQEEFAALSQEEKQQKKACVRQNFLNAGADAVVDTMAGILEFV